MIVWIDTETTGLDPRKDSLLEIAVVITDDELNEVATFDSLIKAPRRKFRRLDEFVTDLHTKSGLLADLKGATKDARAVEADIITFLDSVEAPAKGLLLAGNSIHFDRGFLNEQMPNLMKRFGHQNLDVTSIAHCVRRWHTPVYQSLKEQSGEVVHRALNDIRSSIRQLKWYREGAFKA